MSNVFQVQHLIWIDLLSAQGTSKCFFDDGSLQSVDISPDQNLMVACRHIDLSKNYLKELS